MSTSEHKRILFDFGTSWRTRRKSAVGITRCEHEVARYLLNEHLDNVIFGLFDETEMSFRALAVEDVRQVLDGYEAAPPHATDIAKSDLQTPVAATPGEASLDEIEALNEVIRYTRDLHARPARLLKRLFSTSKKPSSCPCFDPEWYLAANRDVADAGFDPLDHFLSHGLQEMRSPGPMFNTRWYIANNPDVPGSGLGALEHFLKYGRLEGRAGVPARGAPSPVTAWSHSTPLPLVHLDDLRCVILPGIFWEGDKTKYLAREKQRIGFGIYALIYDLIPLVIPQYCDREVASNFGRCLHFLLWEADGFCCISKSTENDLRAYADKHGYPSLARGTTKVLPLGPASIVERRDEIEVVPVEDRRIVKDGFVLFVSTIEARKNHAFAYQLWRNLVQRNGGRTMPLVIVGSIAWGVADLMDTIRRDPAVSPDSIIHLGSIVDAELLWLYENCAFTIFPSFYEGWGIPISESLFFGKPCIAATGSSLEEAGQGLATHIPLIDGRHWLEATESMMFDLAARRTKSETIVRRYEKSSWRDFSRDLVDFALSKRPAAVSGASSKTRTASHSNVRQ